MTDERTRRVVMAGCGTVGCGVAEIAVNRAEELASRTGVRFEIVRVLVADRSKTRHAALDPAVFTCDPADLLAAGADMLVEVIGGTDTAREMVLASLRAGTPVVTANKALLALHGREVYQAAHENGTCLAFESSCAGGLPIVNALLHGLTANRIDSLMGIFNSTCNFVLTQMLEGGMAFTDAVRQAQESGYAEADPTLDVNGTDTAHKLAILASLAFGLDLDFQRIAVEGITELQLADLRIAEKLGYSCKLLGVARRVYEDGNKKEPPEHAGDLVSLGVCPMLVPHGNPLAQMRGTCGGVRVSGDAVGETLYAGGGAGSLPTASGVVADMIDVASGAAHDTFSQLRIFNDRTPAARYAADEGVHNAYYVRWDAVSPADTERQLGQGPLPLQAVHTLGELGAVVGITEPIEGHRLRAALQRMATSVRPRRDPVVLRVLPEGGLT